MAAQVAAPPALTLIPYDDLVNGRDSERIGAAIAAAFGERGLGVLAVTGVPKELTAARLELLALARKLGTLDAEVLAKYERPELSYCAGWSRGREKFKGKLDTAKGSWYANGLWEEPAGEGPRAADLKARYAPMTTEPLWPDADLGGCDLRTAFRGYSRSLYELADPILRHCDAAVVRALAARNLKPASPDLLRGCTHERSRLHVGRLLHYYPKPAASGAPAATPDDAAWCGWHNDNSVLTALAPAIYFDDATGERVSAPDGAGLLAYSREGVKTRVPAPPQDSVLFQIGEAAQILSGGALIATPHAVAVGEMVGVSRESFALFIEPDFDEPMAVPDGCSLATVLAPDDTRADIIPPLRTRLSKVPVPFAGFLTDSIAEYY